MRRKKSTSTIRDYDTVENYAIELEKLCLKCHDDSSESLAETNNTYTSSLKKEYYEQQFHK